MVKKVLILIIVIVLLYVASRYLIKPSAKTETIIAPIPTKDIVQPATPSARQRSY